MARHQAQPKPQSIIHHLSRLGSRVVRPLSSSHKRRPTKLLDADGSVESYTDTSVPSSLRSIKSLPALTLKDDSTSLKGSSLSLSVGDTVGTASSKDSLPLGLDMESITDSDAGDEVVHGSLSDWVAGEDQNETFETMDQNEFLFECFISNKQSDIIFFVHFFNDDSTISDEIEKTISGIVMGEKVNCHLIRVNARMAPLFTMKLGIDPEQPTIVAIRNGSVIDRVSDFSSGVRDEVEHWIEANDFLNHSELLFSLSHLSTE
ncbi:unnamed protein product [Cylindrotheca closterium]|uniref:Thioredoxin domain-containing protein n=1 Tax=Cylindrotheca closterium TaxID=2856 RepID=A0AAD2G8M7_9STRA|nr:unnamed protein product [Cylindrotheca closterium]